MHTLDASYLLYAPPGFAVLSALYVLVKARKHLSKRNPIIQIFGDETGIDHKPRSLKETLDDHDGIVILLFRTLRLVSIFVLLGLEVFHTATTTGHIINSYQLFSYVSLSHVPPVFLVAAKLRKSGLLLVPWYRLHCSISTMEGHCIATTDCATIS